MKKSVIFIVLLLSGIMFSQASAQFSFDTSTSYDSEEEVTFIVEMEDSPVLPEIKLSQETKSSAKARDAQTYRSALLRAQKRATDAISSEISSDEKSYSITFNFMGDDEFSDASLILAFYDDEGRLIHSDIKHNQSVSSGECNFTGDFDVSTADKCKLFIWRDTETIKPLDATKIFDISRYKKGA